MNSKKTNISHLYTNISAGDRDSAVRFLLDAIMKEKRKNRFLPEHNGFDDDVNIYLAHLLFVMALPEYRDVSSPYLVDDIEEVLELTRAAEEDPTLQYFVFKVNADNLLVRSAIFNDLKSGESGGPVSKKEERELAILYYEQASEHHQKMHQKKSGIGLVLEKIAVDFGYYRKLLRGIRKEYFMLLNHFREQCFEELYTQMNVFENKYLYNKKMDQFLAMYHKWLSDPEDETKREILKLTDDLRRLNPEFQFTLKIKDK